MPLSVCCVSVVCGVLVPERQIIWAHTSLEGDIGKAKELFEEARRGGIAKGAYALGCICMQQGHINKAKELYEEAHRGASGDGAYGLGTVYHSRKFRPHTFRLARKVEVFAAEVLRSHKSTK